MFAVLFAFAVSHFLHKVVVFLNTRLKINGKVAAVAVVGTIGAIMVAVLAFVYTRVSEQIKVLVKNVDQFVYILKDCLFSVCELVGNTFGVNTNEVYHVIEIRMGQVVKRAGDSFVDNIFVNTTGFAKSTMDFIVLLVFVFTAIIYMAKNMKSIKQMLNECYFAKEIRELRDLFGQVFLAYIKAQLIIMVVVTVICAIGLYILKNPYSLSIALLIGVVDALPLLGTCVILLPWTLIALLQGEYFYGAMLFTIFVLCYMAREFIEPRVMGKKMGINPVLSLIAVYVGYTLFGFFGMIIGPFVFVIILRIMKTIRIKLENN